MTALWNDWLLTPERVAVHMPTSTAVVADLHLGYQAARRWAGDAVPIPALEDELQPLLRVCTGQKISKLVVAGDLFEKSFDESIWHRLQALLKTAEVGAFALVPGNHDRGLAKAKVPIFPDGVLVGTWLAVHGHQPHASQDIVCGHFHPCVRRRGRKYPCYLTGPQTLILPAYSAEAAGADISRNEAWTQWQSWPISAGRVLDPGARGA